MELQEDSSSGIFGSKLSLALTVAEDDVRTTRLRAGFFLHDFNTFNVPLTAGSTISACTIYYKSHLWDHFDFLHFETNYIFCCGLAKVVLVQEWSEEAYLRVGLDKNDRWCSVEDSFTAHDRHRQSYPLPWDRLLPAPTFRLLPSEPKDELLSFHLLQPKGQR